MNSSWLCIFLCNRTWSVQGQLWVQEVGWSERPVVCCHLEPIREMLATSERAPSYQGWQMLLTLVVQLSLKYSSTRLKTFHIWYPFDHIQWMRGILAMLPQVDLQASSMEDAVELTDACHQCQQPLMFHRIGLQTSKAPAPIHVCRSCGYWGMLLLSLWYRWHVEACKCLLPLGTGEVFNW